MSGSALWRLLAVNRLIDHASQNDPEQSLDAPERRHLVAGKSPLSRPGACTIESGGIPVPN
jgi:hypothetical protein